MTYCAPLGAFGGHLGTDLFGTKRYILQKRGRKLKRLLKIFIVLIVIVAILFAIFKNKDAIMKYFYVIKYSEYVEKYSEEYDVDKYLIYACIKAESNFNEKAESKKGAKGLMQLMDSTAGDIAKSLDMTIDNDDLFNPEINIKLGTKYISKMLQKYENTTLALAAYNAGSGNVDSWISQGTIERDGSNAENIPFKETNNYVRKILKDYKIYKELYMQK